MRTIFIILGTIAALLAAIMTFLPFDSLALAPALLGVIFGYLALRRTEKGKGFPKFLVIVSLLAGVIALAKPILFDNKVEQDEQFELREEETKKEALEELENLDDLEGLEHPTDSIP